MSSEAGDLVEVYRAAGEMEAQVIRSLLEYNGIPSVLLGETARNLYGVNIDGLGEVRVMVMPSVAARARELIKRSDHV